MRVFWLDLTAMGATATGGLTVLTGLAAQTGTAAATSGIVLDATALVGIVTALLASVAGAVTFLFSRLMAVVNAENEYLKTRIAGVEMLLGKASERYSDQASAVVDLLSGTVRSNEVASVRLTESLADLTGALQVQSRDHLARHEALLQAVHSLQRPARPTRANREGGG